MLGNMMKVPGKFYAKEHNSKHSGAWPELHVFDSVEELNTFVAKQRDADSLARADKIEMTQRGEKHWFKREKVSEKEAFRYIDKLVDRGTPGSACIVTHHRIGDAELAKMRAEAMLDIGDDANVDHVVTEDGEVIEVA